MKTRGRLYVISAPSGCGKTTICKKVLKKVKNLIPSVSATTRSCRPGEQNKKDYLYISKWAFKNKIRKKSFLEWERNFDHYYGTPKHFALKAIKSGKDVLLSIDVKGAMHVRKNYPESILIFIKPPSIKELMRRLKSRKTDTKEEIKKRLKVAKKELAYAKKYNYTVLNRDLKKAVRDVVSIIKEKKGK